MKRNEDHLVPMHLTTKGKSSLPGRHTLNQEFGPIMGKTDTMYYLLGYSEDTASILQVRPS